MDSHTHISYQAHDLSYVALIKKDIRKLATAAGFSSARQHELDIVVAEITSNLVKHAVDGEMLVGLVDINQSPAIEIISLDKGPGMRDAKKMMPDGISTTQTLGQGLGSIKRLSDHMEIFSVPGWGTVMLVRKFVLLPEAVKSTERISTRSLIVSKPGEHVSGDGWYKKITRDYIKIFLGDGLGHGPQANFAVSEAINAFKLCPDNSPADILRFIHNSIRKTRGVVGLVITYNIKLKEWKVCGIGNIAMKETSLLSTKNHISYNGIVGHNIPNTINDQTFAADTMRQFVICSDGIISRWDFAKYPMIQKYDSTIQAAVLYKDFGRRNDDMSVIIGKLR
jgi:anti-sigma regulatory factor (Ser/Thr protein kinase)